MSKMFSFFYYCFSWVGSKLINSFVNLFLTDTFPCLHNSFKWSISLIHFWWTTCWTIDQIEKCRIMATLGLFFRCYDFRNIFNHIFGGMRPCTILLKDKMLISWNFLPSLTLFKISSLVRVGIGGWWEPGPFSCLYISLFTATIFFSSFWFWSTISLSMFS